MREGSVWLRLHAASRPPDGSTHSSRVEEAGRQVDHDASQAHGVDGTVWPRRGGPWLDVTERVERSRSDRAPIHFETAPTGPSPLAIRAIGRRRPTIGTRRSAPQRGTRPWSSPRRSSSTTRHARPELACSLSVSQVLERRELSPAANVSRRYRDEQRRPLHAPLPFLIRERTQRAMNTSAASGSMREIEHDTDIIFDPRRQHDGVTPGIRCGNQACSQARSEADRLRSETHRARGARTHPSAAASR